MSGGIEVPEAAVEAARDVPLGIGVVAYIKEDARPPRELVEAILEAALPHLVTQPVSSDRERQAEPFAEIDAQQFEQAERNPKIQALLAAADRHIEQLQREGRIDADPSQDRERQEVGERLRELAKGHAKWEAGLLRRTADEIESRDDAEIQGCAGSDGRPSTAIEGASPGSVPFEVATRLRRMAGALSLGDHLADFVADLELAANLLSQPVSKPPNTGGDGLRERYEAALREIATDRFFFCNKCGHMGKDGPEHPGCNYSASESEPSRIARAALSSIPRGDEES